MQPRPPSPPAPTADALLQAMSEAVYVVDRNRAITYWNRAAETVTGYSAAEVMGRRCRDGLLNHVDEEGRSLCATRCPLLGTMRDGQPREAMVYLHHRDGHRVPVSVRAAPLVDASGAITGAVEVFHDDSNCRGLSERVNQLREQALTDSLTGIANRRMLQHVLRQRSEEYRRYGSPYAVLFADVDHFKEFNDRYGHRTGDEVLRLVAATLRRCTRASDTVGRWGGEEFLIIVTAADVATGNVTAERARCLVASSWTTDHGNRLGVTVSIGVAVAMPGERTGQVVDRADSAMLEAKREGRNRTVVS